MPTATEEARSILTKRLSEIEQDIEKVRLQVRPLEEERQDIQRMLNGQARPAIGRPAAAGSRSPRGKRPAQLKQLVSEHPGIGSTELSRLMGCNVSYIYKLAPKLIEAGELLKEGTGFRIP